MATLIIRLFLGLFFAALSLLLSVDVLLWLGLPGLPGLLSKISVYLLLGAFALLLVYGCLWMVKLIFQSLAHFFSAAQRQQRRVWFVQNKQQQLKRLFYLKTIKLRYVHQLKRNRLLKADNRKQLHALSKTIANDLFAIKKQVSDSLFKQLQQELHLHCKRQDMQSLLQLQQKIAAIS